MTIAVHRLRRRRKQRVSETVAVVELYENVFVAETLFLVAVTKPTVVADVVPKPVFVVPD